MLRGLVIVAIFSLGIAVGCSENSRAPATAVPDPVAPTAGATAAAEIPSPEAPTPTTTEAATDPDPASTPVPTVSRQNPGVGRGFVALDDPIFLAADETEYFGDQELVLGVEIADEVRAYPVRMLRYHHIVNDTVGGEPLLVTY